MKVGGQNSVSRPASPQRQFGWQHLLFEPEIALTVALADEQWSRHLWCQSKPSMAVGHLDWSPGPFVARLLLLFGNADAHAALLLERDC